MSALLQMAAIVDWAALGETVLAALVAGLAFTLTFSLAIVGTTKAAEYRVDEKPLQAVLAGALGGVALIAALGLVVVGLIVMVS